VLMHPLYFSMFFIIAASCQKLLFAFCRLSVRWHILFDCSWICFLQEFTKFLAVLQSSMAMIKLTYPSSSRVLTHQSFDCLGTWL
jgi:hypothetical protein